jgi:hypothetical protein
MQVKWEDSTSCFLRDLCSIMWDIWFGVNTHFYISKENFLSTLTHGKKKYGAIKQIIYRVQVSETLKVLHVYVFFTYHIYVFLVSLELERHQKYDIFHIHHGTSFNLREVL